MQTRLYVTRLRAQLGVRRLLDAVPVAEDIDDLAQPPLGVTFSADDDKENESAALGKTRQAKTRQQLQALFRESGLGAREFLELTQSVIQPRTAEFE